MSDKFETKKGQVLQHLITNGDITSWEAIQLFRATRLSAIIFDLKKAGWEIESRNEIHIDKEGNTSRYVRYYLLDTQKHVPSID